MLEFIKRSPMNKSQAKFHNTAIKMNNALIALLEHKPFIDITIMDICKKAGVNRSTFYAHYENTYDLLNETHKELVSKFFNDIQTTIGLPDINKLNADELIFITPQYIIPYLKFIKDNKNIFRVYQSSNAFDVEAANDLLIENVFVPIYEKYGIRDKNIVYYMSKFFLSGITAITLEWVKRDCVDDILFISEIISLCVRPTMKHIME